MKNILLTVICLSATLFVNANPEPKAISVNTIEVVSNNSISQSITGNVADLRTSETIAGACITYNGKKVYTDLEGNFKIENPESGIIEIKVSMISYEDKTIKLDKTNNSEIKIKMSQN